MRKCYFNKIEVTLRRSSFPVNSLHIFRIPFPENTSEGLILNNQTDIDFKK